MIEGVSSSDILVKLAILQTLIWQFTRDVKLKKRVRLLLLLRRRPEQHTTVNRSRVTAHNAPLPRSYT